MSGKHEDMCGHSAVNLNGANKYCTFPLSKRAAIILYTFYYPAKHIRNSVLPLCGKGSEGSEGISNIRALLLSRRTDACMPITACTISLLCCSIICLSCAWT